MPSFWKDVAIKPVIWLRLAAKLRSPEIYFDAARHLISRGDFQQIADEFILSREQAVARFGPQLEDLQSPRNALLRLGLTQQRYRYGGGSVRAFTTLFHALSFRRDRDSITRACEKFDYFTTSTFSEWVTERLAVGDRIYTTGWGKTRTSNRPGLGFVIAKLTEAAKWDCPADLFGSRMPEMLNKKFGLGKKHDPAGRIRTTLSELVCTAANYIKTTFPDCAPSIFMPERRKRRAHFDGYEDRFTYLSLDESKLPWDDEEVWDIKAIPSVDLSEATAEMLEALGLKADGEREEGSGGGSGLAAVKEKTEAADEYAEARAQVWGGAAVEQEDVK